MSPNALNQAILREWKNQMDNLHFGVILGAHYIPNTMKRYNLDPEHFGFAVRKYMTMAIKQAEAVVKKRFKVKITLKRVDTSGYTAIVTDFVSPELRKTNQIVMINRDLLLTSVDSRRQMLSVLELVNATLRSYVRNFPAYWEETITSMSDTNYPHDFSGIVFDFKKSTFRDRATITVQGGDGRFMEFHGLRETLSNIFRQYPMGSEISIRYNSSEDWAVAVKE